MDWTSSFFERREPAEGPPRPPRPPWTQPEDELPAAVPIRLLLARSEKAAVALVEVSAFSTGFELRLVLLSREEDQLMGGAVMHPRPVRAGGQLPDDFFRFGVGFANGLRASNVDVFRAEASRRWFEAQREGREADLPQGPILMPGSGGGGGRRWNLTFFVWPLPPPGPLTFACEWPAMDIPEARQEVDSAPILEAAKRSEKLW